MRPLIDRFGARWHGPLVGAVFVLAILGVLGPALLSDRVLAGEDFLLFNTPFDTVRPASVEGPSNMLLYDAVYVFHPDMLDAREQLRSGRLPGWSENLGAGRPLLASQQHAILYPPNWLTVLLPFWGALELAAALKLLIAAVGTYLLCVGLGVRRLAATFGGIAFALSGGVVLWLEHPHANVYALAPWLLLFTDRLIRGRRPTAALGLAATVGLAILGGHPQSLFLLLALGVIPVAIFGLAGQRASDGRRSARQAVRSTGLLAGAIALGIVSGAVMLLPFLEALGQASGSVERGGAGLPRPTLNAFFFPELWGRPDKGEIPGGPINFPERTYYFGVVPLALAVGALFAGRLRRALPFAAIGLLGLAVGIASPVSTLVKELPGFASTSQYRSLVLCALAGAVLAAIALDRLLEPGARQRRRIMIAAGAVALLVPLQWAVRHVSVLPPLGTALEALVIPGNGPTEPAEIQFDAILRWIVIAAVAAVAGLIAWQLPRLRLIAVVAVVALTAADLAEFGNGYHPAIAKEAADPPAPPAVKLFRSAAAAGERSLAEADFYGPNLAARFGTLDPRSHDHPVIERYARLWTSIGGTGIGEDAQRTLLYATGNEGKLLDLFGVRYFLSPTLGAAPSGGLTPVSSVPEPVVRNEDPLPRASVVYGWQSADGLDEALERVVASSAATLARTPVIETDARADSVPPPTSTPARIVESSDSEVVVRARARRPGHLILNDTFYPGWRAEIDGKEAEIAPANAAFRAVPIDAGDHRIRFSYEPASVRWGFILSIVGFGTIGALGLGAALLRRRRGPAGAT